jgi:phosphoribosyl 1,2-cyclic phosphodiesterase
LPWAVFITAFQTGHAEAVWSKTARPQATTLGRAVPTPFTPSQARLGQLLEFPFLGLRVRVAPTGAPRLKTGPKQPHRPRSAPGRTRLRFWGVRGSVPTPGPATVRFGGNTACVEVRSGNQLIVLDAGTGLRALGQRLLAEFDRRPLRLTLLLSHTHWDHIQGLPFFGPLYQPRNRLRILGYKGARQGLRQILYGQMQNPFFPVGLHDVSANVSIEELQRVDFHIGKVRVQACRANHPGMCVGYRLTTSDGSLAFFPDNELRPGAAGSLSHRRLGSVAVPPNELQLREFVRGVDVLIMDAQYDREEYRQHLGWGHGCVDDVVALALQAGVKRLFLFHHDPNHSDAKVQRMVAHGRKLVAARKGTLRVEAAREGLTAELGPA